VKNQVIARYLNAQERASQTTPSSVALTPANYKFAYKGIMDDGERFAGDRAIFVVIGSYSRADSRPCETATPQLGDEKVPGCVRRFAVSSRGPLDRFLQPMPFFVPNPNPKKYAPFRAFSRLFSRSSFSDFFVLKIKQLGVAERRAFFAACQILHKTVYRGSPRGCSSTETDAKVGRLVVRPIVP
jgi:hypothetical protein